MISEAAIKKQMKNTLAETNLAQLGERYKGKVRDSYTKGGTRVMITTDRISAFDRVLGTIPFKGQVLNQLAAFWFDKTKDIVPNTVVSVPDPNVMLVKECKIYPVEMVVRGYLAGSAWRDYKAGKLISGIKLPKGMEKNQKLAKPIITPSTKAVSGHDQPISREEIIKRKIVPKDIYGQIEKAALALFRRGTEITAKQGLILVDTKYEFGELNGRIVLADEIHTPDSSRFWYASEYKKRFDAGKEQKMLDKEYLRIWLMEHGFMGDGEIPKIPEEVIIGVATRYIKAYEEITGLEFKANSEPILGRIKRNLGL